MVDRDLLRRKLSELAEYVSQVSEYRDLMVERYRADWKTQRIVERTLQMAIEAGLDRAMVEMTGFRNVIVHEYTRIDAEVVIRILRERLEDFRRFEMEVLRWL